MKSLVALSTHKEVLKDYEILLKENEKKIDELNLELVDLVNDDTKLKKAVKAFKNSKFDLKRLDLKDKRTLFLNTRWKYNSTGLHNPMADLNCKHCRGEGIMDDGNMFGCVLINCPYCWSVKKSIKEKK